jgi:hypothetical protein
MCNNIFVNNTSASQKTGIQKSKAIPEETITLSFKFTDFILHIEHKHLNDIGKFAIFSLRMFRDGHSINESGNDGEQLING